MNQLDVVLSIEAKESFTDDKYYFPWILRRPLGSYRILAKTYGICSIIKK
jgi:hypothetical protein